MLPLVAAAAARQVDEAIADPLAIAKVVVEVAIFAVGFYVVLRFLWATRGSTLLKGLGLLLGLGVLVISVMIRVFELDRPRGGVPPRDPSRHRAARRCSRVPDLLSP
jgi:hypothetical protein